MPVNTLIQLRRGNAGDWLQAPNELGRARLHQGELGYELDTGKIKIGDGNTGWNDGLKYASVPLNSGNFNGSDSINIVIDNLWSSGIWSVNETWLSNFIATSSGALNVEGVQDIIGLSGVVGGFGINKSYDDPSGFTTISVTGMALRVEESTGIGVSNSTESYVVNGETLTNNIYTVSVTGIDHTLINDWDAAISGNIDTQLIAGTGIVFTYDSGLNTLTISTDVLDDTHTHLWDNITDAKTKATLTELGYLSGVVPGTASADRVLVLDSSKDINGINDLTAGGVITASGGFVGNLTGNADSADQVKTVTSSTNSTHYLTFVNSDNGSATNESLYTDGGIVYNPSTNVLSVGGNVTVGGDLTVAGTSTVVNSTVVEIGDNIIRVNTSGLATGGLEVRNSGTSDYKQFVWDNVDGRWELGNESLQASTFISTVASGTAPLTITSPTLVNNLNADLLDNQHGSYYLNWGNFTNFPDPVITVSLSGDVVGSDNITWTNLNGNVSLSLNTVIQPNSVALGTDTTGQYASTIAVAGTGLSATSPNADDGTAYTITSNATPANTANTIVSRDSSGNFSAGTITAALNGTINLANESSDADNYLIFANAATGYQALKTNTSIRFDASSGTGLRLLGSAVGTPTTPATRIEYFIIDGGSP